MVRTENAFARQGRLRHERQLRQAFVAIDNGASMRIAAGISGLSLSGFHYNFILRNGERISRTQLTFAEERKVVTILQRYSELGRNLTPNDLIDTVEMLVSSFSTERRTALSFLNGRPGRSFCRGFEKRHRDAICFKKPSPQEAARFRATNADNLTSHFASIERIIDENSIDAARFANLDESGITPGNDHSRVGKKKVYSTRYATRKQTAETRSPEFGNISRVNLVGVVFASGEAGRPTFIFEGTKLRYRTVLSSGGSTYHESIADCLPQRSDFTTRKDVAGVDKQIFIRWARRFVQDVRPLTAGGRKVLLTYDGYRSHMSIEALEVLNDAGIIAYALPAHTRGTTQPLDVGVFGAWKSHYREDMRRLTASNIARKLDEFDFATVRSSYRKAFTHDNIVAGFRGTGLHPLDEMKIIGKARPYSDNEPQRIASVEEMCDMLDKKRQQASVILFKPSSVLKSGFIDTSKGVMLTSPQAMLLISEKESFRQKTFEQKENDRLNKSVAEMKDKVKKRLERERYVHCAMKFRQTTYGEALIVFRPLALRRAIAKKRSASLRTVSSPPRAANPRVSYSSGSDSETPFDSIPLAEDHEPEWCPTPACKIDMSVDQCLED